MTDEQRQEIMQWQNEGMRAISEDSLRHRLEALAKAQKNRSCPQSYYSYDVGSHQAVDEK